MAKLSQKGEISYEQYCKALHTVKLYSKQIAIHQTEVQMDIASISRFLCVSEDMKIEDLPLSIRTLNLLRRMEGINLSNSTLKDLKGLSLTDLARQKNAGNRTMFEIEELCLYTGIQMLPLLFSQLNGHSYFIIRTLHYNPTINPLILSVR